MDQSLDHSVLFMGMFVFYPETVHLFVDWCLESIAIYFFITTGGEQKWWHGVRDASAKFPARSTWPGSICCIVTMDGKLEQSFSCLCSIYVAAAF